MADRKTLSAQDWIKAGFRALTAGGPGAIKAETIARELKVSKGSFYWHFKDIPSFKAAMLRHWKVGATDAVIANVEGSDVSSADQLKLLLRIATGDGDVVYGGVLVESAIRDWGRYEPAAASSVKSVDKRRIAYLEGLFQKCGVKPKPCRTNANILYGALLGLQGLSHQGLADLQHDLSHLLERLLE